MATLTQNGGSNSGTFKVPQHLHKQHQILFFESDELALIVILFMFALIFGYIFWLLLFVLPIGYFKVKKKFSRGILRHMFYVMGLISFKGAPNYFEKKFNE
jgi:type IV conjugative transfer system protein TraL